MKFKMTSSEKKWGLYDVGNSAFTLLVSTLIPIFFSLIAGDSEASATVYLGYATSIATAVVALLGPVLGAASDLRGMRKKIFLIALLAGAVGCAVLGFIQHWIWFLVLFVLAKSAYSLSLVIYDSMLCDVTDKERMDEVSSRGYAWGYIGSCIPFILCVVVYVLYEPSMLGVLPLMPAMVIIFLLTAVWWVACALPLWKDYKQTHCVEPGSHPVKAGLKSLGGTFKEIVKTKHILLFLIAFFFFIDGVYTIIDLAVAYGTDLGLNSALLLLALLVTQIVAFPAAILLGMLSRKVKPEYLIIVCIAAYFAITVYAIFLSEIKAGEYFGVYDIFGKGASFMGTFLVALVADLTGRENLGVGALAVMFVIGLAFFIFAVRAKRNAVPEGEAPSGAPEAASAEAMTAEAMTAEAMTAEETVEVTAEVTAEETAEETENAAGGGDGAGSGNGKSDET